MHGRNLVFCASVYCGFFFQKIKFFNLISDVFFVENPSYSYAIGSLEVFHGVPGSSAVIRGKKFSKKVVTG